jgi:hypothetical protein
MRIRDEEEKRRTTDPNTGGQVIDTPGTPGGGEDPTQGTGYGSETGTATPTTPSPTWNIGAPAATPNRTGYDTGSFRNVVNLLRANAGAAQNFAQGRADALVSDAQKDLGDSKDVAGAAKNSNVVRAAGIVRNPGELFSGQNTNSTTAGTSTLDRYLLGATPGAMNAVRNLAPRFGGILGQVQKNADAPAPVTPGAPPPSAPPAPTTPTGPRAPGTPRAPVEDDPRDERRRRTTGWDYP